MLVQEPRHSLLRGVIICNDPTRLKNYLVFSTMIQFWNERIPIMIVEKVFPPALGGLPRLVGKPHETEWLQISRNRSVLSAKHLNPPTQTAYSWASSEAFDVPPGTKVGFLSH
jgi:hypothetical protein